MDKSCDRDIYDGDSGADYICDTYSDNLDDDDKYWLHLMMMLILVIIRVCLCMLYTLY